MPWTRIPSGTGLPATRKTKRVRVDLDEASLAELRAYLDESRSAKKYDLIDVVDVLSVGLPHR